MKPKLLLFVLWIGITNFQRSETAVAEWTNFITSQNYLNTKLVIEAWNPFSLTYLSKGKYSAIMARMTCSKICASNSKCLAFNFYSTTTHYVCQHLNDNFCLRAQRVALQAWPEGQVWDKLSSGTTSACIDQRFASNVTANYCEIGRSGCRSIWPNCNDCVQTCWKCAALYSRNDNYDCTLWPEGPFKRPIFGFCDSTAAILIKRKVIMNEGIASPDYLMAFEDMNRLYNLRVYIFLTFTFKSTIGTTYKAVYQNFAIDQYGTLRNMTFKRRSGQDGFNTGNIPLKSAPFTWEKPSVSYNCGPFWLLNSTQGPAANEYCPGGRVNMFGRIINTPSYVDTGIKWPKAKQDRQVLTYAEMKMGL